MLHLQDGTQIQSKIESIHHLLELTDNISLDCKYRIDMGEYLLMCNFVTENEIHNLALEIIDHAQSYVDTDAMIINECFGSRLIFYDYLITIKDRNSKDKYDGQININLYFDLTFKLLVHPNYKDDYIQRVCSTIYDSMCNFVNFHNHTKYIDPSVSELSGGILDTSNEPIKQFIDVKNTSTKITIDFFDKHIEYLLDTLSLGECNER
jgi:hypothetical protein